jgi:hypothetical protein
VVGTWAGSQYPFLSSIVLALQTVLDGEGFGSIRWSRRIDWGLSPAQEEWRLAARPIWSKQTDHRYSWVKPSAQSGHEKPRTEPK